MMIGEGTETTEIVEGDRGADLEVVTRIVTVNDIEEGLFQDHWYLVTFECVLVNFLVISDVSVNG